MAYPKHESGLLPAVSTRKKLIEGSKSKLSGVLSESQKNHSKTAVRVNRRIIGRTTKLSFSEYIIAVFELNEDREALPHPLNDQAIQAALVKEFAHYESFIRNVLDGHNHISKWRYDFNKGLILPTTWPEENPGHPPLLSIRYLDNGLPAARKSRSNSGKVATNKELADLLKQYPLVQETYEHLMERLGRKKKGGIYIPSATE